MRFVSSKLAIVVLGIVPLAVVAVAGAGLLAPERQPTPSNWHKVAHVSELDEKPRPVRIQAPQCDAWTRLPDRVVGHVFVRRPPDSEQVVALRADHDPVFRIAIAFDEEKRRFVSRCWHVEFDLDGKEIAREGIPLIGNNVERLPVQVIGDDVWVRYPDH